MPDNDHNIPQTAPSSFPTAKEKGNTPLSIQERDKIGMLLAPNGKPSNLPPELYAYVRTPEFRQWFGDWLLPLKKINIVEIPKHDFKGTANKAIQQAKKWAKQNIVKTYNNEETGGKGRIQISGQSIDKYLSHSAISKSENIGAHIAALLKLPQIIRESYDVEQHPDYIKIDGKRNPKNGINKDVLIHRLYGAGTIDNELYRIKITLKDSFNESIAKNAHSYEIAQIELIQDKKLKKQEELYAAPINRSELTDTVQIGGNDSNNSITLAKLLKNVEKSYEKGKKILDHSRILDENGEPLVLYRGQWSHANTPFVNHGDGIYFTPQREAAIGYGMDHDPIPVFLNARNPYEVDFEGDSDTEDNDYHADIRGEYLYAREEDFDILIATNTFDGENTLDQYVVHDDAQVQRIDLLDLSHYQAQSNNQQPSQQATVTPSPSDQADQKAGESVAQVRADLQSDRNQKGDLQSPSQTPDQKAVEYAAVSQQNNQTANHTDQTPRFQFIGETGARQLDNTAHSLDILLNLATAKEMADIGKNPLIIKMATGWEQGIDSKWRYEIPDEKMSESSLSLLREQQSKQAANVLADLLPNAPFLKAYPELAQMPVIIENSRIAGAAYDPETKAIKIAPTELYVYDSNDLNAMNVSDILLHEVQHAIQHIEGFATGTSALAIADAQRKQAEKEIANLREVYNQYLMLDFRTQSNDPHEALIAYDDLNEYEKLHGNEIKAYLEASQRLQTAEMEIVSKRLSDGNYKKYLAVAGEVEARNVVTRSEMSPEERRRTLAAATEDVARESQTVIFNGLSNLIRKPQSPLLHNDIMLRDRLIQLMQSAGIAVNTNWQEGQTVIDAANSPIKMMAANGEDTALNSHQWAQVRSDAFKKWFGDWQANPQDASKLIDENGEPMVLYHGTNVEFNTFEIHDGLRWHSWGERYTSNAKGFFFSDNYDDAYKHANSNAYMKGGEKIVMPVYVSMKNPADLSETYDPDTEDLFHELTGYWPLEHPDYHLQDQWWRIVEDEEFDIPARLRELGYDGIIFAEQIHDVTGITIERSYYVTNPNQVKSATLNNGEFSLDNNDIRFFLTPQGDAYGFTQNSTVFIDPRIATAETPIHEYAHLWAEAMRQYNPEEWHNIVQLMKQVKPVWEMVQSQYTHLTSDDDIADEVLAQYSGKQGMHRLEKALKNYDGNISDKQTQNILDRIKAAIDRFWQKTADFLHIHYESPEQVASRVMHDLLHQINPLTLAKQLKDRPILAYSTAPYAEVQSLAHGIKDNDGNAIKEAAQRMAETINSIPEKENFVLIPMPSHHGNATYTKSLAEEIAKLTGLPTADILAVKPYPSLYDYKKVYGIDNLPTPSFTLKEALPNSKVPIIIDNVLDTGTTAYAAAQAFGKDSNVRLSVLGNTDNFYHFNNNIEMMNNPKLKTEKNNQEAATNDYKNLIDQTYLETVKRGDLETAQQMVNEQAIKMGYDINDIERDAHTAPCANIDPENFRNINRLSESIEKGEDVNLFAIANGISPQPEDYFSHPFAPRWYMYDDRAGRESQNAMLTAIRNIQYQIKHDGEVKNMPEVTVYRAVPKEVQEDHIRRNGEWVSPSLTYTINHGEHRLGIGNFRIVKENIPADQLWWDGNDIREWGVDDGQKYAFRNTKNNEKLLDPVTYDDLGNVIPLTKRFNTENADFRFQLAGQQGAAHLDAIDHKGRIENLHVAQKMERANRSTKEIKIATGWERGADNKWRYEIPDIQLNADTSLYKYAQLKEEFSRLNSLHTQRAYRQADRIRNKYLLMTEKETTVGKIISPDSPILKAYPQIANIKLAFEDSIYNTTKGSYDEKTKTLMVNKAFVKSTNDLRETMAHELQHAIQYIEGFALGSSVDLAEKSMKINQNTDLFMEARIAIDYMKNKNYKTPFTEEKIQKALDKAEFIHEKVNLRSLLNHLKDGSLTINDVNAYANGGYHQYKISAGEVEARNVQTRMHRSPVINARTTAESTEDIPRNEQTISYNYMLSANESLNNDSPEIIVTKNEEKINEILAIQAYKNEDNGHVGYSKTISDGGERGKEHLIRNIFYDDKTIGFATATIKTGEGNTFALLADNAYTESFLLDIQVSPYDRAKDAWDGIGDKELDGFYDHGCMAFNDEQQMVDFYEAHRQLIDYRNERFEIINSLAQTDRDAAEKISLTLPVNIITDLKTSQQATVTPASTEQNAKADQTDNTHDVNDLTVLTDHKNPAPDQKAVESVAQVRTDLPLGYAAFTEWSKESDRNRIGDLQSPSQTAQVKVAKSPDQMANANDAKVPTNPKDLNPDTNPSTRKPINSHNMNTPTPNYDFLQEFLDTKSKLQAAKADQNLSKLVRYDLPDGSQKVMTNAQYVEYALKNNLTIAATPEKGKISEEKINSINRAFNSANENIVKRNLGSYYKPTPEMLAYEKVLHDRFSNRENRPSNQEYFKAREAAINSIIDANTPTKMYYHVEMKRFDIVISKTMYDYANFIQQSTIQDLTKQLTNHLSNPDFKNWIDKHENGEIAISEGFALRLKNNQLILGEYQQQQVNQDPVFVPDDLAKKEAAVQISILTEAFKDAEIINRDMMIAKVMSQLHTDRITFDQPIEIQLKNGEQANISAVAWDESDHSHYLVTDTGKPLIDYYVNREDWNKTIDKAIEMGQNLIATQNQKPIASIDTIESIDTQKQQKEANTLRSQLSDLMAEHLTMSNGLANIHFEPIELHPFANSNYHGDDKTYTEMIDGIHRNQDGSLQMIHNNVVLNSVSEYTPQEQITALSRAIEALQNTVNRSQANNINDSYTQSELDLIKMMQTANRTEIEIEDTYAVALSDNELYLVTKYDALPEPETKPITLLENQAREFAIAEATQQLVTYLEILFLDTMKDAGIKVFETTQNNLPVIFDISHDDIQIGYSSNRSYTHIHELNDVEIVERLTDAISKVDDAYLKAYQNDQTVSQQATVAPAPSEQANQTAQRNDVNDPTTLTDLKNPATDQKAVESVAVSQQQSQADAAQNNPNDQTTSLSNDRQQVEKNIIDYIIQNNASMLYGPDMDVTLNNGQHFNIQAITYDDANQKLMMVDFYSGDIEDMAKAKTEDIQKFYTLAIDETQQLNKEIELVKQVHDFLDERGMGSNIKLTGDNEGWKLFIDSYSNSIYAEDPQDKGVKSLSDFPQDKKMEMLQNAADIINSMQNIQKGDPQRLTQLMMESGTKDVMLPWGDHIRLNENGSLILHGHNEDATPKVMPFADLSVSQQEVFSRHAINALENALSRSQQATVEPAHEQAPTIIMAHETLAESMRDFGLTTIDLPNGDSLDRKGSDITLHHTNEEGTTNSIDYNSLPHSQQSEIYNFVAGKIGDMEIQLAADIMKTAAMMEKQKTNELTINETVATLYNIPDTSQRRDVVITNVRMNDNGEIQVKTDENEKLSLGDIHFPDQQRIVDNAIESLIQLELAQKQLKLAAMMVDTQIDKMYIDDTMADLNIITGPEKNIIVNTISMDSQGEMKVITETDNEYPIEHLNLPDQIKVIDNAMRMVKELKQTEDQKSDNKIAIDHNTPTKDERFNQAMADARKHIENAFPDSFISLSDPLKHDDTLSVIIDGKDTHIFPVSLPEDFKEDHNFGFVVQMPSDDNMAFMAVETAINNVDKMEVINEKSVLFYDINDAIEFKQQANQLTELHKLNELEKKAKMELPFANPQWQRDNNEQVEGAKLLLYGNDSGIRAEYLEPAPYKGQKPELGFAVSNNINAANIDSLTEIYAKQHPEQQMVNNGGDDLTVKFSDIRHAIQFQSFVHQLVYAEPNLTQAQMQNMTEIKERYPDTLILNRNGNNYEAYGKDAQQLSSLLEQPIKYDQGFAVAKLDARELDLALPEIIVKGQHVTVVDDKELSIRTQAKVMNEIGSQLIETLGEGHHSLIGHPPTEQLPGFHLATKGEKGYMNITSIDLSQNKVPTVSLNSEDKKTTMSLLLLPLDQQQNLLQYAKALSSYQSLQKTVNDHLAQTPNQAVSQQTQVRTDLQSDRNREGNLQSPSQAADQKDSQQATVAPAQTDSSQPTQKPDANDMKVSNDPNPVMPDKTQTAQLPDDEAEIRTWADKEGVPITFDPFKNIRSAMRDTGLIALPVNFDHDDSRFMGIDGIVHTPFLDFSPDKGHHPETTIAPASVEYQKANDSLLLHGKNINGDYVTIPLAPINHRNEQKYAYEVVAQQLEPVLFKAMEHASITQYLADDSLENNRASQSFIRDITQSFFHAEDGNLVQVGVYNDESKQLHVITHNQLEHTANDTWMEPMKLAEMVSQKQLVPIRKEDLVQPTLTYPTLEEVTAKRMETAQTDLSKNQEKYLNTVFEYDSEKAVIVGVNQNTPREWNPTGIELRAVSQSGAAFSIVPDGPDNKIAQTGNKIDGIILEIEKMGFIDREKAFPLYLMDPISYSRDNDRTYGPEQIKYDGLMVDFGPNHFYFQQLLSGPEAGKYRASYEIENLNHSTKEKVVDMDIDMAFDRMRHALIDYDLRQDQSHSLYKTEGLITNIVNAQPLQMVNLEGRLHNIPTGDKEMADDYDNPKMDVSMLEVNKQGKVILHGDGGPAPLDSLDETVRFEVLRRVDNEFRDQKLDISYMTDRLSQIGLEFTNSKVMMNAYPESLSSIIELQSPKTVETEKGDRMPVQVVLLDPQATNSDEKIKLFKDWDAAYNYQKNGIPDFITTNSANINDLRTVLTEALDKAEIFLSTFFNNMSNKKSEKIMRPDEQKPQQEQPKADQQQKNDNRQQAAEQIRAAIGDDRKVKLNDNERISLETKKGATINVDSVTVGKNNNISVNGEVEGKRQNIQAARLTDDSLSKLAAHLDDLRTNKQTVAVEKPAEQKVSQQATVAPAQTEQAAKADAKVEQKPAQDQKTAQTADQKADQPKERKVDPIEIKPDSKVQVNVVPNKVLDHVYDIQLYVDGQKQGRGHHLSLEDRKAFFDKKTPEEKTAFAASVLPKYFEKELAGQKLPDNIERYRPENKQSQTNDQKTSQQATVTPASTEQNAKADQPKERKVEPIELKPDSKVQVNVVPNKALDHVYDIQLYVDGQKQGRGHHLSIEDRKAFFDKKTPEEKTAFAASVLPKYFEKELAGQKLPDNIERYRPETKQSQANDQKTEQKTAQTAEQKPAQEQKTAPRVSADKVVEVWKNAAEDNKTAFVQRSGNDNKPFYQTFGGDAAKVAQIVDRPTKSLTDDKNNGLTYINISQRDMPGVMKSLKEQGDQAKVVGMDGKYARVLPEPQAKSQNSSNDLTKFNVPEGKQVTDVRVWQYQNQPYMNGKVDGVKLPEKKISVEDYKAFQGQKASQENLVGKYYSPAEMQPKQEVKQAKGMSR